MRPLRLELRGFTAFRNETVVDFEHRHLFAITGPTGAGKSSLLDAITWALYGRVPRVGRETKQLLSHGAQAMAVRLDFRVRGQAYRVSRQVGRKTVAAARLDREVAPDEWRSLADRVNDVADEVERITGIDYETFTKTVLLPQGAFDAFLRGDPGERRAILSNLLGLSVYEQMREGAQARAAGASGAAKALQQQADHLGDATAEAIAALEAERDVLAARIATVAEQRRRLDSLRALEREASERARDAVSAEAAAVAARQAEEAAVAARQAEEQAQAALAAAEAALVTATTQLEALTAERASLGYDAERHQALRAQAEQLVLRQRARAEVAAAAAALAEAQQACAAATSAATDAAAEAKRQQTQSKKATKALAGARDGLALAAGAAVAVVALLRESRGRIDADRADAEREATDTEERVRLLDALAKQATDAAADLERADAEVQRATASAAVAEAERVRAEAAVSAASTALDEATVAREQAGREHVAADLRRALRVGDPCPVCGEPITTLAEHAAPDLDAAVEAVQAAESSLRAARAEHEQRVRAASLEHGRVEAAQAGFEAVRARLDAVEHACADADVTASTLGAERARAVEAVAGVRTRIAEATQRAAATGERERGLELLLASVPTGIEPRTDAPVTEGTDSTEIEPALRAALAAYAAADTTARTAENAQRTADEAVRAASAAQSHAEERVTVAQTTADGARARLVALPAPEHEDGDALIAALAAADAQARRHAELDDALRAAEQQRAASSALREVQRGAVITAAAEAGRLAALAGAAAETASAAAATYAEQWQALPAVTSAPDAEQLARWGKRIEDDADTVTREHAIAMQRVEQARQHAVEAEQRRAEATAYERLGAVAQGLEQDLRRNNFIAYVQREAMQALAGEAADRMEHLSRGRYRMRADGDEFVVIDRLNGDEQRSVKTLSGGETFLASLALALALAERLPQLAGHGGAMSLESLFLDEGFGTLDADALDVAIEALELLAGDSRMIGVISHVPLIAERLPDRIEVVRAGGGSTVRG